MPKLSLDITNPRRTLSRLELNNVSREWLALLERAHFAEFEAFGARPQDLQALLVLCAPVNNDDIVRGLRLGLGRG